MRVNLRFYDWIIINTSAGKDSQTMLEEVVKQARREGVMDRVVVVHADLGKVEWPGTKELAKQQAAHYGLDLVVVKRPQGDLLDHVRERAEKLGGEAPPFPAPQARYCTDHHKTNQVSKLITKLVMIERDRPESPPWPDSLARYCTSDHKRAQVTKLTTQLVKRSKKGGLRRKVRILNCLGIRSDESPARSKKKAFSLDRRQSGTVKKINGKKVFIPGKTKTVHTWYPIFDWSVDQVWESIRASGVPSHYAYSLGMSRLSCCFCIFAPRAALMLAGLHNRALLDEYCQIEEETGWNFRKNLSLREVRAAIDRGEQPGEVKSWEM